MIGRPTLSMLIFVSLVRYTFSSSHMAVIIFTVCYHVHLLSLVQSFIRNLRLGSFHHRPFPRLSDWFHGLSDHFTLLFCSTTGFVSMVCQTEELSFRTHLKSLHFHFIHSFIRCKKPSRAAVLRRASTTTADNYSLRWQHNSTKIRWVSHEIWFLYIEYCVTSTASLTMAWGTQPHKR